MQCLCFAADVDTRRRAACDLVQALSKSFEGPVIQNFSTYIQGLLGVRPVFSVFVIFHVPYGNDNDFVWIEKEFYSDRLLWS